MRKQFNKDLFEKMWNEINPYLISLGQDDLLEDGLGPYMYMYQNKIHGMYRTYLRTVYPNYESRIIGFAKENGITLFTIKLDSNGKCEFDCPWFMNVNVDTFIKKYI